MKIRELADGEESEIWGLFFSTVRHINARDYSQAQVEAWAPDSIDARIWKERIRSISPFVADVDGVIVGYSDLQADGRIDHLFVHHQWQRRGVGKALMAEIERLATARRIPLLRTQASVTARPFFEAFRFHVVAEQDVMIRGEQLKNFVMQREIPCAP